MPVRRATQADVGRLLKQTSTISSKAGTRVIGSPGRAPKTGKFPIAVICGVGTGADDYTNYLTDDWAEASLGTAWWRKGPGWEKYRDACIAQGANPAHIEEAVGTSGPCVRFVNTAYYPFFRSVDAAILLNIPPPKVLQRMKTKGLKVGWWVLSNWAQTGTILNGYANDARLVMVQHLLAGTPKDYAGADPCDGDTTIDPSEPNAWPGGIIRCPSNPSPSPAEASGHAWAVNFASPAYAPAIVAHFIQKFREYWYPALTRGLGCWDWIHSDNFGKSQGPFVNFGAATNDTNIVPFGPYNDGKTVLRNLFRTEFAKIGFPSYGEMSGNVGDFYTVTGSPAVPEMSKVFWEFPFNTGDDSGQWALADILAGIKSARTLGQTVFIGGRRNEVGGVQPCRQWEIAEHPDWARMAEEAGRDIDKFYASMFADGDQNSTTGILGWNKAMRPVGPS